MRPWKMSWDIVNVLKANESWSYVLGHPAIDEEASAGSVG